MTKDNPASPEGAEENSRESDPPGRIGNRTRLLLITAPLVGAALFGVIETTRGEAAPPASSNGPPPPTVTVSEPLSREIIEWEDYTGRFTGSQSVEIRPRVSGELVKVHFDDGATVEKGQLLFTIDQRPFLAALSEAEAAAESARTSLKLARSELARAERLLPEQAVSLAEVDSLRAKVDAAEAAVAGAEAQVRSRNLDLAFTQIRAPISGRISDRRVDVGNQVTGGGGASTLMTTIKALDPIYFTFNATESLYLNQKRGDTEFGKVEIRLQGEEDYAWTGQLDFLDNAIDAGSGTIRGRAVLSNPDHFLVPGMFGEMRLAVGAPQTALLVPDAAVQTDQVRKVIYVAKADDTIALTPVTIGPIAEGLRVIKSGLDPHDRVVIEGVQFVQPGAKVTPQAGNITATSLADASVAPTPVASQASIVMRP